MFIFRGMIMNYIGVLDMEEDTQFKYKQVVGCGFLPGGGLAVLQRQRLHYICSLHQKRQLPRSTSFSKSSDACKAVISWTGVGQNNWTYCTFAFVCVKYNLAANTLSGHTFVTHRPKFVSQFPVRSRPNPMLYLQVKWSSQLFSSNRWRTS